MQAIETAEAAAAAICDVPCSAPDKAAYHQQDGAGVALLPAAAGLHCGPLHQLPGLRMVTHLKQLKPSRPIHPHPPHIHKQPNPYPALLLPLMH